MFITTILAIDWGKYNSNLCWYEVDSRQAVYRAVAITPEGLRTEFLHQPITSVVIEACSQAGWVNDLCLSLSLPCHIANINDQAWQWNHV